MGGENATSGMKERKQREWEGKWYNVNEGNSHNWNERRLRGDDTWGMIGKNGTSRIRRKMAQLE